MRSSEKSRLQRVQRLPGKARIGGIMVTTFLALLSLAAAAAVALIPLLTRISSPFFSDAALPADLWLLDQNRSILVSGLLIITFFLFSAISRWQILRNPDLRAGNGCLECRGHDLVRVHRRRSERFLARFLSLPIGRYSCRECYWEGLRLVGNRPIKESRTASGRVGGAASQQSLPQTAMPITATVMVNDRLLLNPEMGTVAAAQQSRVSAFPVATADGKLAIDQRIFGRSWKDALGDYAIRPFFVALAYLLALTIAEVIAVMVSPVVGVILHVLLLFALILHASFTWELPIHRFLLALTLVPLIRIISLSLPLVNFQLTYWFFITSVPLFAAAYLVMRQLNFTIRDVFGFSWRGLPGQLLIGLTGIFFGYVEYEILQPEPLIDSFTWSQFWLPALILMFSTGFLEEYIFRFILQRTSVERLGALFGIVYVALFFAVLHIGYRSVADFLFVLVVGLFFGWMAYRTKSIIGVTLSHGLTNVALFLIVPYMTTGIT